MSKGRTLDSCTKLRQMDVRDHQTSAQRAAQHQTAHIGKSGDSSWRNEATCRYEMGGELERIHRILTICYTLMGMLKYWTDYWLTNGRNQLPNSSLHTCLHTDGTIMSTLGCIAHELPWSTQQFPLHDQHAMRNDLVCPHPSLLRWTVTHQVQSPAETSGLRSQYWTLHKREPESGKWDTDTYAHLPS